MQYHQDNLLMVRLSLALLSGFASVGALSTSADDVLPPRFNFDRYTRMVDQSPFAIATAAALPQATPDFAKDLYIANAARSPEGDMATLMSSSDRNFKKYLTTREPVDGYSIASIKWSEDVGKTKVTISKDGQFATLIFNQSLLSQATSAGRPVVEQMPPRVPTIPLPGADIDSRAHARGGMGRNPKRTSAPPPEPAAASRSVPDDLVPLPNVPVFPRGIAPPKPLRGNQDLSDKEPTG